MINATLSSASAIESLLQKGQVGFMRSGKLGSGGQGANKYTSLFVTVVFVCGEFLRLGVKGLTLRAILSQVPGRTFPARGLLRTGRRWPHSGKGEDFLTGQPGFFYENGCNSGTESRKIDPKVGNEQALRGLQTGH